jgi:hypothetical protein
MALNSLKLTRNQLASFLKDPEQIKQFERLTALVDLYLNQGTVDESDTILGSVSATANAANSLAVDLDARVRYLELAPREEIVIPPASGGAGVTLTTVEVNVGSVPKSGGSFTIAGAALTVGKPVLINQAVGPYTGKGTLPDEAEMDQVNVAASVTDAATITAYWSSARRVKGNFKFNYQVSA